MSYETETTDPGFFRVAGPLPPSWPKSRESVLGPDLEYRP